MPRAAAKSRASASSCSHTAGSGAGIVAHSRNTRPLGANGSPVPSSISSMTRSRGSLTTSASARGSNEAK